MVCLCDFFLRILIYLALELFLWTIGGGGVSAGKSLVLDAGILFLVGSLCDKGSADGEV